MRHLANLSALIAFLVAGLPGSLPVAADAPVVVVSDGAPLSTSCQCITVTCGNGGMSPACQVSCPGQAMCACASCVGGNRASAISGQNSCTCQ